MGHYHDLEFTAKLTDLGVEILRAIYEPQDFKDIIAFYGEYKFVEKMLESRHARAIFFSVGSDLKSPGHSFDEINKTWSVWCFFKSIGSDPRDRLTTWFLPNIITEPVTVKLWWEGDPHHDEVAIPVKPVPDWFRKYGD